MGSVDRYVLGHSVVPTLYTAEDRKTRATERSVFLSRYVPEQKQRIKNRYLIQIKGVKIYVKYYRLRSLNF